MFDGVSDRVVSPGVIVVLGDKIRGVGATAEIPPNSEVIDLGDATLLPGFIDAHSHADGGLMEVANPSALFLAERRGNIAGSAVFAGLEGTRPVLVEVQALLSPNPGGSPRRSVIGWDG